MTKKRKASAGSQTYSTRFDDEHERLVLHAAKILGWSPAKFLRVAAVERAGQVINVFTPRKLNVPAVAKRIAEQLVAPKATFVDEHGHKLGEEIEDIGVARGIEAIGLSGMDLDAAKEAIRLGGTEFCKILFEILERPSDDSLPEPVDPGIVA